MFFVRSQVRHTGCELTQADDASLLAPRVSRFQNTQSLAYNPRRSPAQFSYQNCEPLPRSVIQPGLNCDSHVPIVLQVAVCMTDEIRMFVRVLSGRSLGMLFMRSKPESLAQTFRIFVAGATNSDGCRLLGNCSKKRYFACGGLQPSELFSAAL